MPKFRAYDEETETMLDVLGFDLDDNEIWSYDQSYELNKCKIMQSTGLFDQNGVEIYTGDILDIKANFNRLGLVIFDHGKFKVQHVEDTAFYDFTQVLSQCEVIGNIYENKEVWEASK